MVFPSGETMNHDLMENLCEGRIKNGRQESGQISGKVDQPKSCPRPIMSQLSCSSITWFDAKLANLGPANNNQNN